MSVVTFSQVEMVIFFPDMKIIYSMKRTEYLKKKKKRQKSTRVKVFHKGRSLELVKNVGRWALWTSWAEVLAALL